MERAHGGGSGEVPVCEVAATLHIERKPHPNPGPSPRKDLPVVGRRQWATKAGIGVVHHNPDP